MTKSMQTLAAATARRQRHRHRIGRLRDQIASPKHCPATNNVFCAVIVLFLVTQWHSTIYCLKKCGHVVILKVWASQARSRSSHFVPSLFGNLHDSSRLLAAWDVPKKKKHKIFTRGSRRTTACGFACCGRLVSTLFSVGRDAASACSSFRG